MDAAPENGLKVLMLPWLAHGHVSPFLELAKKLSKRNFFIYLCSTSVNLRSPACNNLPESIKLVEIRLPNLPNLPPCFHTTDRLPPHLMDTLKEAFKMSKSELFDILYDVKPDFLIHDTVAMWAGDVASSAGIPAIDFLTFGAAFASYVINTVDHRGQEVLLPAIYLRDFETEKVVPQILAGAGDDFNEVKPDRICNIRLIKSSKEIEGKFIDYFTNVSKKQVIPVGVLVNQEPVVDDDDSYGLVRWLDTKDKRSCVFVSFGSEYFLTNEEIEEIANGLEISNVNFIWVVRLSKEKEDVKIDEVLPTGFLDRIGGRGRIVEGWAPQLTLLKHQSIGGFLSHCGWSSVLESMRCGVPIIAMPMHLDQPFNARLVVDVGVGLEIEREAVSGRVTRAAVAEAVKEVVMETRGKRMRKRAREISDELMSKRDEEIDNLIKQLVHINEERMRTKNALNIHNGTIQLA